MKTKFLFSAVALSAAFVACTNEDVVNSVNEEVSVTGEIVGADLVSNGGKIAIGESVGSRVAVDDEGNTSWESTDKLALAWYNVAADGIYAPQDKSDWKWDEEDSEICVDRTADRVYANHLFTKSSEGFATNSNIYQGAHFIYFPYSYVSQIDTMKFDVNAVAQTTSNFTKDIVNNALFISAADFIEKGDVDPNTGELEKKFYITPAVNTLKVNATPQAEIAANDFLKGLEINQLRIWAHNKPFATKSGLDPHMIPHVQFDNGKVSETKTYEVLKNYLKNAFTVTATNELVTKIDADITLANSSSLRAFTLPVKAADPEWAEIQVNVDAEGYYMGQFKIQDKSADATNKATIEKLVDALSKEGYNGKYFSSENMNEASTLAKLGLDVNLLASEFVADYTISDLTEWNLTVKLVDALNAVKGTEYVPTFTLTDDITFDASGIATPVNGVNVLSNGNQLIVGASTTWPSNLNAELTESGKYLEVVVKNGATLEVNSHSGKYLDFLPEAGSIINLNKVESEIHLANDVAGSRININVYGAKVSLGNQGAIENATIAYVLPAEQKNYQINNLIATENQNKYALVNTIVVTDGRTFDLAAVNGDESVYDPYTGSMTEATKTALADEISSINIELKNGTVINGTVANVTVLENSTLTDVKTTSITVATGKVLTINSDDEVPSVIEIGTMDNKGTITADGVTVKYEGDSNGTLTTANGGKFTTK